MNGHENLKPSAKGTKGGRRQVNPSKLDAFCLSYYLTGSAERAAVEAGYRTCYAHEFLHKQEVQQRLEIIKGKVVDESVREALKRRMIKEDFVDANLADVILHGGGHPTRGEADRVNAINLAYKKMNLLGSPTQRTTLIQPEDGTMREIYKALWLREKEATFRKEFEEEAEAEQPAAKNGNGTE